MDSRSSILRTEARAEIPNSGDLLHSQRSRRSHDDKSEITPAPAAVLVIDDDEGTRETFEWALKPLGFLVRTASCAGEGITIAKSAAFDLVLVDLKLPDMLGTDLIRTLRETGRAGARFVLLSGFLTTQATVDAMKSGAVDVREKPISIEDLRSVVSSALREPLRSPTADFVSSGNGHHSPAHSLEITEPQSAVEAWVKYALKACYSERDIKTLREWCSSAAVSYTKLRECCDLVGYRRPTRAGLFASLEP